MKILKMILIVFVVLFVLSAAGLIIFVKTFDINKYKPQIIEQASKAVGRNVGMGKIDLNVSLSKGIRLGIEDFTIADDPQFSKNNFFKVEVVDMGVDIMAFATRREISVSNILVQAPRINIIRNKDGVMNVQNIGPAAAQASAAPGQSQSAVPAATAASPAALPALLVESIQVKDAVITYVDGTFSPQVSVEVADAGMAIEKFSLTEPFKISMKAKVMGFSENVNADGTVRLNVAASQVRGEDIVVTTDLSKLDIAKLKTSLPMLKDANLPTDLKGKLRVTVKEVVAGAKGLESLSASGEFMEGSGKLKGLAVPFEDFRAAFTADTRTIDLRDTSLKFSQGTITENGTISDYLGKQDFKFESTLDGISLAEIISQSGQPVKFQGKLYGQLNGQGHSFDPKVMINTLAGEGKMEIKDARLTDMNILKVVLDKISMVPNLVEKIESNLPEKYKEKLKQKDTVFNAIKLETNFANGAIMIKDSELSTDEFILSGKGQLGFDQTVTMEAALVIPAELSASMVASVPELQTILDDAKQIRIPVRVSGQFPTISVVPDLEYLAKRIIANKGKEELQKVLDKVFDRDEPPPADPAAPQGQTPAPTDEEHPEREILDNILDNIFK